MHERCFIGKTIDQVDGSDSDDSLKKATGRNSGRIYDKWSQAVSRCPGLVSTGLSQAQADAADTAVLPVLVVPSDALWTVDFNQRGEVIKTQANRSCRYLINQTSMVVRGTASLRYNVAHMDIITFEHIPSYVHDLFSSYEIRKAKP